MKKMKIGGSALKGGLSLQSENYYVSAEYLGTEGKYKISDPNSKVKLTEKSLGKERKFFKLMRYIPLLRGILMPLMFAIQKYLAKELSASSLIFHVIFYSVLAYAVVNGGTAPDGVSWINFIVFLPIVFLALLLGLLIKFPPLRDMFQFHGAEHVFVKAYESDIPFDSDKVFGIKPFHPRCGSNYAAIMVATLLVCTFVLVFWMPLPWAFVIAHSVSLEIFLLANAVKFLQKPLSVLGVWLQKYTALQPEEKHLKIGRLVITRLLELEESKEKVNDSKVFNNMEDAGAKCLTG